MNAPLACRRCGCPHVRWATRSDGSHYLGLAPAPGALDDPSARAYWSGGLRKRPHRCGTCHACVLATRAAPHDHYASTDTDPACNMCVVARAMAPLTWPCGCRKGDPHLADCRLMAPPDPSADWGDDDGPAL